MITKRQLLKGSLDPSVTGNVNLLLFISLGSFKLWLQPETDEMQLFLVDSWSVTVAHFVRVNVQSK